MFANSTVFNATIELGRFSSPIAIKDGLTLHEDLFTEVESVLTFIKKHVNKEYRFNGDAHRIEKWEYPMDAIREIVINMIVHRDYSHSGDSSIKIFNNKIEFFNPGRLPNTLSIQQLVNGQYRITSYNVCYTKLLRNHQRLFRF